MYILKITLTKEINEDTNKWKDTPCPGMKDLILVKCPHCPNLSTKSMENSNTNFHRNGKK